MPTTATIAHAAETPPQAIPAMDYARFAERFRGSEEHVKEQQKFYIHYFKGRQQVLDIGCGRGEFLELMRKAGVTVQMVRPPKALDDSFAPNGQLMAGEGWRIWRERIEAHGKVMDPWIVKRFEVGRDISDDRLAGCGSARGTAAGRRLWTAGDEEREDGEKYQ